VLPPGSTSAAGEALSTIKATRRAGFTGEVELAVEGLPAGVKVEVSKIVAGTAESTLKLNATEKAEIGTNFNLTVIGSFVFNDRNYKARTGKIALSVTPPEQAELATNAPPAAASTPASTK
jgi:chorismate synthase